MARSKAKNVPEGLLPLDKRCQDVWDLDLFRECGCGCLACPHGRAQEAKVQASLADYARTQDGFGTPDGLGLNRRLPEQLQAWIHSAGDDLPRYVTVGYHADPLPGFAEAEEVLDRSLRLLLSAGVGVSMQTRRLLPERILNTLAEHSTGARVTVPLPTLNDAELKVWEPNTALANQRLWNLQQLRLRRVPVSFSIKPLIPYVNDDRAHLAPLLHALADTGARRLTAEFMRLTHAVRARLERQSPVSTQLIFGAYTQRELDQRQDRSRPNLNRRRTVYRTIAKLAAERRMRFALCRCADPVLGRDACQLWPGDAKAPAPTRQERARVRRRPLRSASQVGLSDLWDSKQ